MFFWTDLMGTRLVEGHYKVRREEEEDIQGRLRGKQVGQHDNCNIDNDGDDGGIRGR